jgi:signal transduction histidine kinase
MHFAIIIITHISYNISHKITTPLAQLTTATEILNTTIQALNSTQQKTNRICQESKNDKKINYQNSIDHDAIFRALSQLEQLTNNHVLLVFCNRLVPI